MRNLTVNETKNVNGALGPVAAGAAIGAFYGGYQYFSASGSATWGGAAVAIGSGAIGGAVAGMGGFAFSFYGGGLATIGGMGSSTFMNKILSE
jgi:hypothetical protein